MYVNEWRMVKWIPEKFRVALSGVVLYFRPMSRKPLAGKAMKKTTSVRLPDDVEQALVKLGEEAKPQATLSAMIRLAAEDYVKRNAAKQRRAS
jgi:hypothetical protein